MDRSVVYRDAIDLGRLIEVHGRIPDTALEKATQAYGADIERKAVWVVNRLADRNQLGEAAMVLQMDRTAAANAISAFRAECRRIWPDAAIDDESVGQPPA